MTSVEFIFSTGIKADLFKKAILNGSWNDNGEPTNAFSETLMQKGQDSDGCPSFRSTIQLASGAVGQGFRWGVRLTRQDGSEVWGIAEEVNDQCSRENVRMFTLQPAGPKPQQQHYLLNWSRRLGAQKLIVQNEVSMQFSVWAPNATQVEVVMAQLHDGQGRAVVAPEKPDPELGCAIWPVPSAELLGGYIADDGDGAHPTWGPFAMSRDADGVWRTDPRDPALADFSLFDNCPYMFRIKRADGSTAYRTDIYSRCQIGFGETRPNGGPYSDRVVDLDGSVSCSVVKDPDRVCEFFGEDLYPERHWVEADDFWNTTSQTLPKRVQDLVIYELHIGALGWQRGAGEPGTLEDACNLIPYLKTLGVNAIELLPLAEFGGGGANWGYATSHYFAIEYAGGGRDKYKHFIRKCHAQGIAVILDVVFNHYSHNAERAQWMYDTTEHEHNSYYWYEGRASDYAHFNANVKPGRQGQGGYVDNLSTGWAPRYWEPMVRRMFVGSLLAHVTEFMVDGFRFDQTTSIHSYNVLHADGRPVSNANAFGLKLLREATRALRIVKPDLLLMAEDHSHWEAVARPLEQGGLGFDATWFADFYHHLVGDTDHGSEYAKLLKTAGLGDERPLAISAFANALASSGQGRVVYQESHDEAGNGKLTDRTINVAVNQAVLVGATRRTAEARDRTVTGITMLSAGVPMFLFGEEVGAEKKFLYGQVLDNREDLLALRDGSGRFLFRFYQDLIALRHRRDALRSTNIEVVYAHNQNRVLAFRRWQNDQNYLVIANFGNAPFNAPWYEITSERLGDESWREVFNSDATAYGGDNVGNLEATIRSGRGRFACVLPANGLVVFERN